MWSGKGDFTQLATGARGFQKTSMSICLYIQPQPLMTEMTNMFGADGFLDRFLFIASRPVMFPSSVVRENFAKLQQYSMQDFSDVFVLMHKDHLDGKIYTLSESAQKIFDEISDSYAAYLDDKYKTECMFGL